MWLTLGAVVSLLLAFGPTVALDINEIGRWRRETGRKGSFCAMRYDSDYQRASRRSGRAFLGILTIPWFFLWMVVFSQFLEAALDAL